MRMRLLTLTTVAALTLGVAPFTGATAGATVGSTSDTALTTALGNAVQAKRVALGRDRMWTRAHYRSEAQLAAQALLAGSAASSDAQFQVRIGPVASAATMITSLVTSLATSPSAGVASALGSVVNTDAGWAVYRNATTAAAVVVVGQPDPSVSPTTGCSVNGFCWQAAGVNPHLPWTRNRLDWWLSTAGLPSGGESVVRTAIARMNAMSGLGIDLHYAGLTSVTSPSSTKHFVIVFADSSMCGASAWGCSEWLAVGSQAISSSRIVLYRQKYLGMPSPTIWAGIASHELGHSLGLAHYNSTYGGRAQLMRAYTSTDNLTPGAGDVYGARRINPAGTLETVLTKPAALVNGTKVSWTVFSKSSGLGGVRRLRVDCTDRVTHAYKTVVSASGAWDILAASRHLLWTVNAPVPYTATCRSVIASKTRYVASAPISVALG